MPPDDATAADSPLEAPESDPVETAAAPEPEAPEDTEAPTEQEVAPTRVTDVEVQMKGGIGSADVGEFAGSVSNPHSEDGSPVGDVTFEHVAPGVTRVTVKAKAKDGPLVVLLDVTD